MMQRYERCSLRNNHSKGVENYFTDALLYQEISKELKEPLPDDDNSGNEADSESKGDMSAALVAEPIVVCFDNPQCNNPSEDNDEWVINDNVIFDYPASVELLEYIVNSSLHMPLHKPSITSTFVECVDGSVFVIPPSKRSQSLIVFGRAQLQRIVVTDSSSDSKPSQIFHYARSPQHMMRKMGYSLQRGSGLNFRKGRRAFLRNFMPKGKPTNYYDKTHRGLGYLTPPPPTSFQSEDNRPIPSRSASSFEWESDVSVGIFFKNVSVNMTLIS